MSKSTAATHGAIKTQRIADASSADVLFTNGVCQAIYVGSAGDLHCLGSDSTVIAIFDAVPVGTIIPIQCHGVSTASTMAGPVTAMFNN